MMRHAFAVLFALAAAQIDGHTAQAPATIRVEANLVELEVLVSDSRGRSVPGLPSEAFRIREDGVPQSIESFKFERRPRPPRLAAPSTTLEVPVPAATRPPRRYTVWAVDHLNTKPFDAYRVRQSLQRFLKGGLMEGEAVALVSMGRGIEFVLGFTSDPGLLEIGIERLSDHILSGAGREMNVGQLLQEMGLCRRMAGQGAPGPFTRRGSAAPVVETDSVFQCMLKAARDFSRQEKENASQALHTYRAMASSLAGLEGSKRVFVFSGGFSLMPGEVAFKCLSLFFPSLAQREYSLLVDVNHSGLFEVISSATRANVTFYAIDARGLTATPMGGDASEAGVPGGTENPGGVVEVSRARHQAPKDSLAAIAVETGGRFFDNDNDLAGLLQRAYDDGAESYVIGYYSSNPKTDGKYRRIQVDLPETGYSCKTRAGYYARPFPVIPAELEFPAVEPTFQEGLAEIPYRVQLRTSAVHFERRDNGERVGALSVQGRLYSGEGLLVSDFFEMFSPTISKGAKAPENVRYSRRLAAPPGSYRLLLHFRDLNTGGVASIDQSIQVPARKPA